MVAHCHKQVREVARAICGELYETLMGDNEFFATWKKQNPGVGASVLEKRFIDKNWGQCLKQARKALAMVLTSPTTSEKMKEEVMDILEKDQSLMRGRNTGRIIGMI